MYKREKWLVWYADELNWMLKEGQHRDRKVRLWKPIFHTMLRYSVLHPGYQEQQDNVIVASVMKHNECVCHLHSFTVESHTDLELHVSFLIFLSLFWAEGTTGNMIPLRRPILTSDSPLSEDLKNTLTQTRDVYEVWSERRFLAFPWIMHCVRRICCFTIWDVAGYECCLHKSVLFWQAFNSKAE